MHRCQHCACELPDDGFPDWMGGRLCDRCIWAQQIVVHRRRQPLVPWWVWVLVKSLVLLAIVVGIGFWLFYCMAMSSLR